MQTSGLTGAELCQLLAQNKPQTDALHFLRTELKLPDLTLNTILPLHCDHYSALNLVTTSEALADDWHEDAVAYAKLGS